MDRESLAADNVRLVTYVAKKYLGKSSLDMNDLMSAGNMRAGESGFGVRRVEGSEVFNFRDQVH